LPAFAYADSDKEDEVDKDSVHVELETAPSYEEHITGENKIEMETFRQNNSKDFDSKTEELPVHSDNTIQITPLDSDNESPTKKETKEKTTENDNNNETQSERKSGQIKEVEQAISILKRLSTIKQDDDATTNLD